MPVITNPYRYAVEGGPTFGNASREFDGTDDYVSWNWVPDVKSISVWVKFNSLKNGPVVYAGSDSYNSNVWDWSLFVYSGNIYARGNPGGFGHVIISPPTTEVWHHIVIVRSNDTGNYEGWADGIKGLESSSYAGTSETAGRNLRVGKAASVYADVSISDLRLYDINLSSSDISNLYNGVSVKEENLIGWFFTDNDDVLDYSGNGNDGTDNGSTYLPSGPFGVTPALPTFGNASRDFDGVDDYINFTFPTLTDPNAFTISTWIKLDDASSLTLWLEGGGGAVQLYTHQNEIVFGALNNATPQLKASIVESVWVHAVYVVTSITDRKLYINGSLSTSGTANSSFADPSGQAFYFGARGGASLFGDGKLSDFRVYDKPLTSSEVSDIYNGTHVSDSLVGWWLTDEFNYTDVIVDYSGNGNNGTNNGSTYSVNGPFDTFTPTDIAGCVLWLDGADNSTLFDATSGGSVVVDDGNVARWEDKSASGNDASQSILADRPIWRASEINGNGVVDFGSRDGMPLASSISIFEQDYTSLFVFRRSSSGIFSVSMGGSGSTQTLSYPFFWYSDNKIYCATGTNSYRVTSAINSTGVFVASIRWIQSTSSFRLALNGVVQSTSTGTTSNIVNIEQIGKRGPNSTSGAICEIAHFNTSVSESDIQGFETSLGAKWGVTITH